MGEYYIVFLLRDAGKINPDGNYGCIYLLYENQTLAEGWLFSSIESIRFKLCCMIVSILPFYRPYSIKRHKSSPFLQEWVFFEVFFIYIYNKGAFTKPSFEKNVGSSYGDRS